MHSELMVPQIIACIARSIARSIVTRTCTKHCGSQHQLPEFARGWNTTGRGRVADGCEVAQQSVSTLGLRPSARENGLDSSPSSKGEEEEREKERQSKTGGQIRSERRKGMADPNPAPRLPLGKHTVRRGV